MSADSSVEKPPKKLQSDMRVIAEYSPMEILPFTGANVESEIFEVNGNTYRVKMGSLRLQTFCKSLKCARCGLEGTVMRLEHGLHADPQRPHFNLYGFLEDGRAVLMTRDHIIPKSRGGRDIISNLETLCTICNGKKGNRLPDEITDPSSESAPVS